MTFTYKNDPTLDFLLGENARLNEAVNIFFLRDPDKASSWEYSRYKAEEMAKAVLTGRGDSCEIADLT